MGSAVEFGNETRTFTSSDDSFKPTRHFYIHPSDSPISRLISDIFDGNGFVL